MVHTINYYDYEERVSAFWDGFKVEFLKIEAAWINNVKNVNVITNNNDKIIVKYEPAKSHWEDIFN